MKLIKVKACVEFVAYVEDEDEAHDLIVDAIRQEDRTVQMVEVKDQMDMPMNWWHNRIPYGNKTQMGTAQVLELLKEEERKDQENLFDMM